MIAPVIVIRPEPGCATTVAAARAMGMEAHGFALSRVEPVAWTPSDPAHLDALLLGSANALRHGGLGLAALAALPAYAVGATTAAAARAAGLTVVATGAGGLQALLDSDLTPAHHRLLRLTGEEGLPLHAPPGVTIAERVVYSVQPRPMPAALARLLMTQALPRVLVLIHSAAALRHFAGECYRLEIARGKIALIGIGPRVIAAAGPGWAEIAAAASPDDTALLALARRLCHHARLH